MLVINLGKNECQNMYRNCFLAPGASLFSREKKTGSRQALSDITIAVRSQERRYNGRYDAFYNSFITTGEQSLITVHNNTSFIGKRSRLICSAYLFIQSFIPTSHADVRARSVGWIYGLQIFLYVEAITHRN